MIRGAIGRAWLRRLNVALAAAAGLTLVSIDRAAANNEAAPYLRDHPYVCWQVEAHFGARGWERLFEPFPGDSPPGTSGYEQLLKYSNGYVDTYGGGVFIHTSERGVRLRQIPCPPPLQPTLSTGLHPFWGVEVGGGWAHTRFNVDPPFDVNGSGFVSGINGGFLVAVPGTQIMVGPRVGVQGNFFSGTTVAPPASPFFDYTVKNPWTAYQEALVQFNFRYLPLTESFNTHAPSAWPFVTLSAGIAEGNTRVQGATPGFSVIDTFAWTGPTVSVGVGVPLNTIIPAPPIVFGGTPFLYGQYRATWAGQGNVNIPGTVQIDPWIQSLNFGLQIRY